ncbi:alpha/beta fold hydrolase [Nonomuraea endophytica]|uniref:Pimeloyl-ACP methyl ester carboxylesterase n=1 Tax=Nonomuraea endophytica TaxID=714136 RepID=A0A7W8EFS2_9ACTN|nr:alpha/beta hydrolase [Nonomuraea endophytica]MBB5077859.1 pimeloyl-ACP methyl ester carboxylesterase [Nonomuraea endophytica]
MSGVEWAEFGDPAGRPVVFVHGYASSRWAAGWTLSGGLLVREGIRVLAPDRPGYGGTPPMPPERWTAQVAARAEEVGPVVVAGVSMGASSALRLAAARPDLVTGVALLSGMAPVPATRWSPAAKADAFYWRLARRAPWLLRRLCAVSARAMASADARVIPRVERALPAADLEVFRARAGTAQAAFLADANESARQGGAAMADDLLLHLRPWDIAVEEVRTPVRLIHGVDDPKVPVSLARTLAARLPRVETTYLPGGHFAPFADQEALMDVLGGARF